MGYTTEFYGEVTIDPPLNEHEISFLTDFNETRRMIRTKGPLFVGGSGFKGQGNDDDVLNHNRANGETNSYFGDPPPAEYVEENGQPGLWCQWVPNEEGTAIRWDDGEKFYNSAEWMKYIVEKLLAPSAQGYVAKHVNEDERLKHFTFNHTLNGQIEAQGEESDDRWMLVVKNNVVMVALTDVTFKEARPI